MIRWIDVGLLSGIRSQSIYHGMAYSKADESENIIMVSVPEEPYVCVGYFQDPEYELDLEFCKDFNLRIIRRQTGGGAVYIDHNQIFIQWIFKPGILPPQISKKMQFFLQPIVDTYREFGIEAYIYGDHDVHVDGKKIVGTGAARIGNAEVLTGNFILDFNSRMMARVLRFPNEFTREQFSERVSDRMSSFKDQLGDIPDRNRIIQIYKEACQSCFKTAFNYSGISKFEEDVIASMEGKLSDSSWTFEIKRKKGKTRVLKVHTGLWITNCRIDAEGYKGSVNLIIEGSEIRNIECVAESGFDEALGRKIASALEGCKFRKENIYEILTDIRTEGVHPSQTKQILYWRKAIEEIRKEKSKISGGI